MLCSKWRATSALNHAVELSLREAIGEQTHSAVKR
jgi:hypothetical protein